MSTPTPDQALAFYRAALAAARFVDLEADPRTLDRDADLAWRAYGDDLPVVVRCDLVLRNLAMLYPAAFAPGPVFGLAGWYEDCPWGTGFERPSAKLLEAHFGKRQAAADADAAFDESASAWGVDVPRRRLPGLAEKLARATHVVVSGAAALAEVVRVFTADERLSLRAQVILVSDSPGPRHLLGVACALSRQAGVPHLAQLERADGESWADWAKREKARLGITQARFFVRSPDASVEERAAAEALASALDASDTIEVSAG